MLKTVLIPPILDWGFLKQLPQQIATQFARNGYRVLFCNNTHGAYKKVEVEKNLFVYHNSGQLVEDVKEGKEKIDILYNTWARNNKWVKFAKPKYTIYHSCDVFDEWKSYEKDMIDQSDLILCTSKYIYDIRKHQHKNVHLVRNACSSEFIDVEHKVPDDMKFIKEPIFLFAGAVGKWVSTYLIKKIANDYATVFVGKEFGKPIASNVINLGTKTHDDLLNYYASSDVGLIPFNVNSEITLAANPIKVWEYLSCGLPVLATSWDEMEIEEFKDVVFTAKTHDEYVDLAHDLAKIDSNKRNEISKKAIEIAKNNTWEKRFEYINSLL